MTAPIGFVSGGVKVGSKVTKDGDYDEEGDEDEVSTPILDQQLNETVQYMVIIIIIRMQLAHNLLTILLSIYRKLQRM